MQNDIELGSKHTWYSLISDLSKPGMKRVMDLLLGSNLTELVTPPPLSVVWARRFRESLLEALNIMSFQSRGVSTERCGEKASGKGEKFFLIAPADSTQELVVLNAPETCAPA